MNQSSHVLYALERLGEEEIAAAIKRFQRDLESQGAVAEVKIAMNDDALKLTIAVGRPATASSLPLLDGRMTHVSVTPAAPSAEA